MSGALRAANRAIFERTIVEADKQGMGTTASCLMMGSGRYIVGHIGDSRIYMLRDGVFRQVIQGSFLRAGAGGRRLPDARTGSLPPLQQRHHAVRGRQCGS